MHSVSLATVCLPVGKDCAVVAFGETFREHRVNPIIENLLVVMGLAVNSIKGVNFSLVSVLELNLLAIQDFPWSAIGLLVGHGRLDSQVDFDVPGSTFDLLREEGLETRSL